LRPEKAEKTFLIKIIIKNGILEYSPLESPEQPCLYSQDSILYCRSLKITRKAPLRRRRLDAQAKQPGKDGCSRQNPKHGIFNIFSDNLLDVNVDKACQADTNAKTGDGFHAAIQSQHSACRR
jgi:hypothetical protein